MKKIVYFLSLTLMVLMTSLTVGSVSAADQGPDDECPGAYFCEDDRRGHDNPDDESEGPERDPYPDEGDDGPDGTGGHDPYFLQF